MKIFVFCKQYFSFCKDLKYLSFLKFTLLDFKFNLKSILLSVLRLSAGEFKMVA